MKVLHVISRLDCHGPARQLGLLQRHFPQTIETRVCVLGAETPGVRAWRAGGTEVQTAGYARPRPLSRWWRLRRLVRAYRPDIVHAWDGESLRAIVPALGRARLVAGQPLPRDRRAPLGWLDRWGLRRASRLLTRGQTERTRCLARGLPADKLIVVPLAVAPGSSRDRSAPELPGAGGGRWIVCAGELIHSKGLWHAIWAFDVLRFLYSDLHLIVVGDGPQRDRLEHAARSFHAESRVHFLGWRIDAANWLARADIVWGPDLTDSGINVTLEALAAGRPVIASRTPTRAEMLDSDSRALLYEPGDKVALARLTRELLDNPHRACRLGEAGRDHVRRHFGVEKTIAPLLQLYSDLAAWP